MIYNTEQLRKIRYLVNFFRSTDQLIKLFIKRIKDLDKFYDLIMKDDLIYRRDEFYSLFKSESIADCWWCKIWEEGLKEIKPIKTRGEL